MGRVNRKLKKRTERAETGKYDTIEDPGGGIEKKTFELQR